MQARSEGRRRVGAVAAVLGVLTSGLVGAGGPVAADPPPPVGAVTQPPGVAGCLRDDTTPTADCTPAPGLDGVQGVVVAPDGRHAYAVAVDASAVTAYARDAVTGSLAPLPGGCVAVVASPGCAAARGLAGAYSLAVSPDGDHVYAVSAGHSALVVLDRDPLTGLLSQPAGAAGCLADPGSPVAAVCGTARGIDTALGVAVSPDGRRVYATGMGDDAVAVLVRDLGTGALAQPAGADGCLAAPGSSGHTGDGCTPTAGLVGPQQVAASDSGAYVASGPGGVVALRVTATGLAAAGCVARPGAPGSGGCIPARGLGLVSDVAVSPDGRHVYTAGGDFGPLMNTAGEGIAVLDVDPVSGALSQRAGASGCVARGGEEGCGVLRGADDVYGLGLSPDGRQVYAGSYGGDALLVLDRDQVTGDLTQPAGAAGCLAPAGAPAVTGDGCGTGRHLGGLGYGPGAVAVSPDGRSVYAAAYDDDALVVLARTPAATDVRLTGPGDQTQYAGHTVQSTVTVTNDTATATAVRVGLDVTGPATVLSTSTTAGHCWTAPVSCRVALLSPGATATVTVSLRLDGPGQVVVTATALAAGSDVDGTDDVSTSRVASVLPPLPAPVVPAPEPDAAPDAVPVVPPTPAPLPPTSPAPAPALPARATVGATVPVAAAGAPATVGGAVVDRAGRPAAGAVVRVLATAWGERSARLVATVRTDARGAYRAVLRPVVATRYAVTVTGADGTVLRPPSSVLVRVAPRLAASAQPVRRDTVVSGALSPALGCVPVTVSAGSRVLATGTTTGTCRGTGGGAYSLPVRLPRGEHVLTVRSGGARGLQPVERTVVVRVP